MPLPKRPTTILTLLVTALLATATVRAASVSFMDRMEALEREADVQRKKLGLEQASLDKSYPTPEMTFERPTKVVPGKKTKIVVPGRFAEGTRFVFQSDDVVVLSEKSSKTKYEAEVTVRAGTLPGEIYLTAFVPVSGRSTGAPVLEAVARYRWDLKLANGDQVVLEIGPRDEDENNNARIDWRRNGKPWLKATASVYPTPGQEELEISVVPGVEEEEEDGLGMTPAQQAMYQNMARCAALPESEQLACISKLAAAEQEREDARRDVGDAERDLKSGLLSLKTTGAKVTGTFTPNDGGEPIKLTGSMKPIP